MIAALILKGLLLVSVVYILFVSFKFIRTSQELDALLKTKTAVFWYMVFPTLLFLISSIMVLHHKVILLEHAWYLLGPCFVLVMMLPEMWVSHKRACAAATTVNAKEKGGVDTQEASDAFEEFASSERVKETDKISNALEFEFDDDLDDAMTRYEARQDEVLDALLNEVKIYHVLLAEYLETETDLDYKTWLIRRLKRVKAQNEAFDEWVDSKTKGDEKAQKRETEQEATNCQTQTT